MLTHLCQASPKSEFGKHYRPNSDAAFCGTWSGSVSIFENDHLL